MENRKKIVFIILILQMQFCFGQYELSLEKELIIDQLKYFGFDTIPGSEKLFIDSSHVVIAKFNANYCSSMEYHLENDGETYYNDSIFFTSSCNECFDVTLNSFLSFKKNKWKMKQSNEYYSLRGKGKFTSYGPPKVIKYQIYKLEVINSIENTAPCFKVHSVWVSQSEFKRLKKLKTYSH